MVCLKHVGITDWVTNWGVNVDHQHARVPGSADRCWRRPDTPGSVSIQQHVDELGVELTPWSDRYLPSLEINNDTNQRPPDLVITHAPVGWVCFNRSLAQDLSQLHQDAFVKVGQSKCEQTTDPSVWDRSKVVECLMSVELTLGNIINNGMRAPNGTYLICGSYVYSW